MFELLRSLMRFATRPATLLAWGLFTLAATVTGPFNTLSLLEPGPRALYWGAIVGVAMLVSHGLAIMIRALGGQSGTWQADALRVAGMTVVFSPLVHGWTEWMIPVGSPNAPNLLRIAVFVVLIGTVVQVSKRIARGGAPLLADETGGMPDPVAALRGAEPENGHPDPEPVIEPEPRLMRRLPEGAAGPILRLSASDHFVEVVLPAQTHSLRMRFNDAIDEMDGVEGYCSHRSHWVSRAAIRDVERDNGRIFLRLSNGDLIPVSRTYKPGLQEAGVL